MYHLFDLKMNLKRVYFVSVFGFILLSGCAQASRQTAVSLPTPTPLPTPIVPEKPTYMVEKGTVVKTLEFTGRVSPVMEQELFFKTDGFVANIYFDRGDRVQAGALLAELEIGDLQSQLAQLQVALLTAEVKYAKDEQDTADELAQARVDLDKLLLQMAQIEADVSTADFISAQIKLEQARRTLIDAQEAYNTAWDPGRDWETHMREPSCLPGQGGSIPCTGQYLYVNIENERNSTERGLASAQDSLRIAQAEYNDLYAAANLDSYDVQILQKDIELVELKVEQLQRGVDPLLELDVERARLDIEDIERQIAEARLFAPFDGELLTVAIRSGDNAQAFKTVVVLAEPEELELTAELSSDDLREMSIGQVATIRLRNRPEEDFIGHVRQLPYPYGGGTVETDEDDTAVRITLDESDVKLELGELASVIIVLEEKQDALWLPPAAIRTFQGRTFVVVQEDEGQRRIDVRLGIESDQQVEILEGVEQGHVIIGE